MTCIRRFLLFTLLGALALARPSVAQDPFAAEEAELVKRCVGTLMSFANSAKSNKVGQRAKQAFDLVLAYDPNNSSARSELGFRKEKDVWVELPPEKRKKWVDKANYEGRFKVMDEWAKTSVKLADFHKKLGLKMQGAGNARAIYHLEKAVYYNPMDKESNIALGYKEGPGFFGTDHQIEFAMRLKEVETHAVRLARKKFEVEELPQERMPVEFANLRSSVPDWMKKPNFDISGAKSTHFTVWLRGTQENANNAVQWGERALEFGIYLLGAEQAKQLRFVERASGAFAWRGFLWTPREREEFLKANPHVWQGSASNLDEASRYRNNNWDSKEGSATITAMLAPVQIHDSMIANVFQYGFAFGRNEGLGEGLIHAATWYLQSTCVTRFGADAVGTQGAEELRLPDSANWWLRAVRDQAMSGQDWPLAQVPRERLSRFRNDCRLKAWSFMTWVIAAYPGKWVQFMLDLPDAKKNIPTLDEVEKVGVKHFGKSMAEVDAEWREWARGDSGVASGTGYGPPLLPERPSREELAVLDRLNAVRATGLAYSWKEGEQPWDGVFHGMPACELDAEASVACEAHAKFLSLHPKEHLRWPEAHEENPALEGFTPRGQRAAMSSVIVHREGTAVGLEWARSSIDGWIGTPYHRFPLLEHNISRIGYAHLISEQLTVGVLDMGSLQDPYDPALAPRFVCWPPHGMKGVPTSFHGREQPNPLEDQPPSEQDITKTGYPISLQLQREFAGVVADSGIQLFEARSGGKAPAKHAARKNTEMFKAWTDRCKKEVPIYAHTPTVPLNRKVEIRDVVFAIPKTALEPNKHYQVQVRLQTGSNDPFWFFWEFSTGSQKEGLDLK